MGFAVGLSSGVIGLCVGRVLYMEFFHVNIEPAIYYKLGFFFKLSIRVCMWWIGFCLFNFSVDLCRKSIFPTRISVTPWWWESSAARACCFRKRRVNLYPTWSGADTGWSAWKKWRDCRARGMHLDDVIRNFVGKVILKSKRMLLQ